MWKHVALAGVAVWSMTGCGSGSSGSTTTAAATTTTVTAQQLSDGLLTVADLEAAGLASGWTETQRDVFATRQPENPSIDPSLWCPAGHGDVLATLAGQRGADVELSLGGTKPSYMLREQAWSATNAGQYFTAVQTAVAACRNLTWGDGQGNSYTLQPLTAPTVGDMSTSWTVSITLAGASSVTAFTQQTVARFGNVVMVIQGGAAPDTSSTASAPNYTLVVRAAATKVHSVATP